MSFEDTEFVFEAVLVTHTSVEGRTCLEEIRAGATGDVELPL